MPAVKENTQGCAELKLPIITPRTIPTKHRMEDTILYRRACLIDIPTRSKTAKSPEKRTL